MNPATRIRVTLINQWGLHARAAFSLASAARRFTSDITVEKNGDSANGKEVGDLLTLCAAFGDTLIISAEGPDGPEALDELKSLVEARFGEDK